jgi:predicted component of type VI protein secretion system
MFVLKLFHQTEPDRPIAAHMATDGLLRVGRDPGADWVVADPHCEVSRTHFELHCEGQLLTVTPVGTNGVSMTAGQPLAHGEARPLVAGDAIHFGKFRMTVEAAPVASAAPADHTILAAPFGSDLEVPAAWPDPLPRAQADSGESLLDAFCRGADLDVSAFSGEDPARAMERAGEIYRQMVLGLGDLMTARSAVKRDHRLNHTTIGAEDNNPFKWAPSRRLASDLLLRQEDGFLAGPDAIHASFTDVKKHMLGTLAGFRAAIDAVIGAIRPAQIEARVRTQKSMLQTQSAACWSEFVRAQNMLASDWARNSSPEISDAFIAAYEAHVADSGNARS